jgi:hypothetical protein
MTEPRRYHAYLLRLRQANGEDGCPVWRAAAAVRERVATSRTVQAGCIKGTRLLTNTNTDMNPKVRKFYRLDEAIIC